MEIHTACAPPGRALFRNCRFCARNVGSFFGDSQVIADGSLNLPRSGPGTRRLEAVRERRERPSTTSSRRGGRCSSPSGSAIAGSLAAESSGPRIGRRMLFVPGDFQPGRSGLPGALPAPAAGRSCSEVTVTALLLLPLQASEATPESRRPSQPSAARSPGFPPSPNSGGAAMLRPGRKLSNQKTPVPACLEKNSRRVRPRGSAPPPFRLLARSLLRAPQPA